MPKCLVSPTPVKVYHSIEYSSTMTSSEEDSQSLSQVQGLNNFESLHFDRANNAKRLNMKSYENLLLSFKVSDKTTKNTIPGTLLEIPSRPSSCPLAVV
jgi:hypothetical protein